MTNADYAISQLREMITNTIASESTRHALACFGFAAQCQKRFPRRAAAFRAELTRLADAIESL